MNDTVDIQSAVQ